MANGDVEAAAEHLRDLATLDPLLAADLYDVAMQVLSQELLSRDEPAA